VCLIIEEILQDNNGDMFVTQKALCVMSKFRYYELHLNLLNAIMSIYKLERFNIFAQMTDDFSPVC
jgi:hypothetical protein